MKVNTVYGSGGGYIVKPFLVIPSDWRSRISQDQENTYIKNIQKGMEASRQFYASHLYGHTFDYDPNVQVINSDLPSSNITESGCVVWALDQLNIPKYDPVDPEKITNLFFIVGSGNIASCAMTTSSDITDASTYNLRVAAINHQHLEMLGESDNRFAVGIISHELGHTFGLSNGGLANGHPCSIIDEDQCKKIPDLGVSIPYPPASECLNSVMGLDYCGSASNLSNLGFDNSDYNPEIRDIYKSPFINPDGSSAPVLVTPPAPVPGKITELTPNPIISGSELTIRGSGFGRDQGLVALGGYNPVSWTDTEIKVVPIIFDKSPVTTSLSVRTKIGEWIKSPQDLTIEPSLSSVLTTPTPFPTFAPFGTPAPTVTPSPLTTPVPTPFSATPSPFVTPTLSPTPSPAGSIASIKVSNYIDFRTNPPGDSGSSTQTFIVSTSQIPWVKSTLDPSSPVYILPIYSDGKTGDILRVPLANGQLYQIPNSPFIITAKVLKKIVKITVINGSQQTEIASNFTDPIDLNLQDGVNDNFHVIVNIYYNDGSSRSIPFNFIYQPNPTPSQCPIPVTPPFPRGSYAGQSTDCATIMWFDPSSGKTRNFRNGVELNPSTTNATAAPATPVPVNQCTGICISQGSCPVGTHEPNPPQVCSGGQQCCLQNTPAPATTPAPVVTTPVPTISPTTPEPASQCSGICISQGDCPVGTSQSFNQICSNGQKCCVQ